MRQRQVRPGEPYTRAEMGSVTSDDQRTAVDVEQDAAASVDVDEATSRLVLEARESERGRLAEALHDGPAQVLSNAVLRIRVIERALRADPATATAELDGLREDLERETERLRDYIRQLRPSPLQPGDLASELSELAGQLRQDPGLEVDIDLAAPESELEPEALTAVLRVALEALRNIRKHAHAQRVRVTTRLEPPDVPGEPGWWILEVEDDGEGFVVDAPEPAARRHFGLRFMRERAQQVGGQLEIVSGAAAGTTVRLRLHPRERSRTTW
jgi:signal transduction histidine kinase